MFRGTSRSGLVGRLQSAGLDQMAAMLLGAAVYPFSAKEIRKMGPGGANYADFTGPLAETKKERATQVAEGYLARTVTNQQVMEFLATEYPV